MRINSRVRAAHIVGKSLSFPTMVLCLLWMMPNSAFADSSDELLFVRRVKPVLAAKCLPCHGENRDDIKGGLDLTDLTKTNRTGDSNEKVIIPGDAAHSPIYLAVTRHDSTWSAMPPKEADRLTNEQVAWVKLWIDQGAPWPDEVRTRELLSTADADSAADGVTVATSGGTSAGWTNRKYQVDGLWAYQPVRKPHTQATGAAAIDELIGRLMPDGVTLSPPADARTFIRRATFDLIGLPPTPDEVESFERQYAIDSDAAVGRLIDRLVASPHYGERMAQHWLDVVRYADSSGFANDYERGNAWRYRDYIVRAFNSDKPYDQFVREQIAGDELEPNNPEMLIATGFLRMGPWELTGMEVAKVARQRFLDDVTNSVGESFLAHALQCARCHDHKFDPIPTADYYAIQATFATTQIAEREAMFLPSENTSGFDEQRFLQRTRAGHLATLAAIDEKSLLAAAAWYIEQKLDVQPWKDAVESAGKNAKSKRGGIFGAARNSLLQKKIPEEKIPPRMVGLTAQDMGLARIANKGLERLAWELDRYRPYALSVYNGRTPTVKSVNAPLRVPDNPHQNGELEQTCILVGGDPFAAGKPVAPGLLSVIGRFSSEKSAGAAPAGVTVGQVNGRDEDQRLAEQQADQTPIAGRRRELAQWITDDKNPLTSRAIVNRIWMWHFGEPIAGNPNNFGSSGKRPTHPELLDWLAATLVEQRWSIKSLHRQIMSSAAYRRSAEHDDRESLMAIDPQGTSYASFKPRRLSAQELRDSMLSVTDELNRTLGGIPNRPEINFEAAMQPRQVMGTFASAWVPNPLPSQRHRRSLYSLKLRGLMDPALEVFNAPAPDFSCERRESSTIVPQVFLLFNSRASQSRALAFASRVLRESTTDDSAITKCFRLAFGRTPLASELQACKHHWSTMQVIQAQINFATQPIPLEVRRDAVEENSGERITFVEQLYANAEFVPDLLPQDCNARTRALADVCLVLLNSNEFAYIY